MKLHELEIADARAPARHAIASAVAAWRSPDWSFPGRPGRHRPSRAAPRGARVDAVAASIGAGRWTPQHAPVLDDRLVASAWSRISKPWRPASRVPERAARSRGPVASRACSTRRTLCAPSRPSASRPSASRSKAAPQSISSLHVARALGRRAPQTASRRTGPAPASRVSSTSAAPGESSGPARAAMPPCA